MLTGAPLAVSSGYRGSAFRNAWVHRASPDRTSGMLPPDGTVDLLWADGELIVSGPYRSPHKPLVAPGRTVAGLRFARGAAAAWLRVDMRELVGRRVPLGDIVGHRNANAMAEKLRSIDDPAELASTMARAIVGEADADAASFATAMIRAIQSAPADAVLPAVLRASTLSERTLRRRCDQIFGYGPRTLNRILRLQRLLDLLKAEPTLPLAAAAAACDYADQPHMTREARALTGRSPRELASNDVRSATT